MSKSRKLFHLCSHLPHLAIWATEPPHVLAGLAIVVTLTCLLIE